MATDATYQPQIYRKQGGDELVIGASGTLTFATGAHADGALVMYPASAGTDANAGLYIRALNDSTSFFSNQTSLRSYLVYINGNRPSTKPLGAGGEGVDDASLRIIYRSYAADGANVQSRGLNVQSRHSGSSGGSLNNLISTNASTSTALGGNNIALTVVNENYAPSTAGVSAGLQITYLHEGPNAGTGEYGLWIQNQKKNGSAQGAYIYLDDSTSTTALSYGLDMSAATFGSADIRLANSVCIQGVTSAITDNSTTSTLPEGSLIITTHNTGKGTLFIVDSSGKCQALAQA